MHHSMMICPNLGVLVPVGVHSTLCGSHLGYRMWNDVPYAFEKIKNQQYGVINEGDVPKVKDCVVGDDFHGQ